MRLDLALIERHPELSRRKARDVIEKGQVRVNGLMIQEPGGDVSASVALEWNPNRKALPRARLDLKALYRDDRLLIVDKPAGLLSVPTSPGAGEDTVRARVESYVTRLRPRKPYVGVVHRLDRDTSGALAFALDEQTRQALRALFREHRIERRYAAIVIGRPSQPSGSIELPLADVYEGGRRRVARPGEPAHTALTRYRVIEAFAEAALLEVELMTGRQHQIRVHLSHAGLPILGDPVYGTARARLPARAGRQMLHARVLGFVHPISGDRVRAVSPLPADFERALTQLRQTKRSAKSR